MVGIGIVPYDPSVGVTTAWDLGIGDSTAIFFAQWVGQEVRIIDYYENSGVGLDHYAKELSSRVITTESTSYPTMCKLKN